MTNLEVAQALVENALAYAPLDPTMPDQAKEALWRLNILAESLTIIRRLLEDPSAKNTEYDWEDFK